jgi:hypothetical protein
VLHGLRLLEETHGEASGFKTWQLIDAIWFEVQRLAVYRVLRAVPDLDRYDLKLIARYTDG